MLMPDRSENLEGAGYPSDLVLWDQIHSCTTASENSFIFPQSYPSSPQIRNWRVFASKNKNKKSEQYYIMQPDYNHTTR